MTAIVDGEHYERETFTRLAEHGRKFAEIAFTGCIFDSCTLIECAWYRCSFTECRFRHCDLSLAAVPGSRFPDVRFTACKLLGVDWTKAGFTAITKLLLAVQFEDCLLNYASFFGLVLRRSRFVGCIAREVDFREADLSDAVCTTTDFTGSKFHHTNLTKADFRGATGYAINPVVNTITKARFSLPEAISLLSGFDLVIE